MQEFSTRSRITTKEPASLTSILPRDLAGWSMALRIKSRKFAAEAGAHPCESCCPRDSIRVVIELGAPASCEQPGITRNRHHGNRREKRHGTKTFGPKSIGIKRTAPGGGSPQVPDRCCGGRGGERSGIVVRPRERRHLRNIAQCRARSAPVGLASLGCGRGGRRPELRKSWCALRVPTARISWSTSSSHSISTICRPTRRRAFARCTSH